MGDGDGRNTAQGVNQSHCIRVDQADAVPQDIPSGGLYQERPLTNGELGFGFDAPNSLAFLIERVAMRFTQII